MGVELCPASTGNSTGKAMRFRNRADEYTYELRTGFYRGNLRNDEQPTYHRKG